MYFKMLSSACFKQRVYLLVLFFHGSIWRRVNWISFIELVVLKSNLINTKAFGSIFYYFCFILQAIHLSVFIKIWEQCFSNVGVIVEGKRRFYGDLCGLYVHILDIFKSSILELCNAIKSNRNHLKMISSTLD